MTKAINPHAVIPKLFASWQQEDVPAQPTQLSMFFHLYEADIGQYCSLDKELGRYHSSLLAHYNPSLLHTSHLYKRGCKRRAAGCVLPVLIPQNRRLKVRFFPALLLSFSWEDKF